MPHGHASRLGRSPTYYSWMNMIQRCTNPNFPRYLGWGGRGIVVCERWSSFENFLVDMGERPMGLTLDRIDNDGPYEPSNCRWATRFEQQANRHITEMTRELLSAAAHRRWAKESEDE